MKMDAKTIALVTTIVQSMQGASKKEEKEMPKFELPKIQGCICSTYKNKQGHITLRVTSNTETKDTPTGANSALETFVGKIFKADGSVQPKENLALTVSNLKKKAELESMVADELAKHFGL